MTKAISPPEFIESTTGQVAAELAPRHGERNLSWPPCITGARDGGRLRDEDIDQLIKQAQKDVEPLPG
jgi:hypothetical protein